MGEGAYRFAIRPAAVAQPIRCWCSTTRSSASPLTQFAKDGARPRVHEHGARLRAQPAPVLTELDTRGEERRPTLERSSGRGATGGRRVPCPALALPRPRASSRIPARRHHGGHAEHRPRVPVRAQALLPHDAEHGGVRLPNPLVDRVTGYDGAGRREDSTSDGAWPRMPDISGVAAPRRTARLSDSYFKLVGDAWLPQIVDDPSLPARVLAGGRRLPGWRLRDECVTRLLFESGGRVSEITGLTLADWVARGMLQEATTSARAARRAGEVSALLQRHGQAAPRATSTRSDGPSTRAASRVRISSGAHSASLRPTCSGRRCSSVRVGPPSRPRTTGSTRGIRPVRLPASTPTCIRPGTGT